MTVVMRYIPPDEYDPRVILQECLRMVPEVKAKDFWQLHVELEAIAKYYSSLDPPDYDTAKKVGDARQKVEDMARHGVDGIAVMQWIADSMLSRKVHRAYLNQLQVT